MQNGNECGAGRQFIPVAEAFQQWDKELEFRTAYSALDEEFALAAALIETRLDADESTNVNPSTPICI